MIKCGLMSEGEVSQCATVTVHYSLYLEDEDEPFDSTVLRGRAERFKLDSDMLVEGMELAIKSMKKGERSEFLIASGYGYGDMGCPPRVPGKAQIRAKVELLHFAKEAEADALLAISAVERRKEKTFTDIERVVRQEHVEGNDLVKSEDFRMAVRR